MPPANIRPDPNLGEEQKYPVETNLTEAAQNRPVETNLTEALHGEGDTRRGGPARGTRRGGHGEGDRDLDSRTHV